MYCFSDNRAPVAVAGPDRELILPVSSMTLNGSDSTDDQAITSYQWEILRYSQPVFHFANAYRHILQVFLQSCAPYMFIYTVSI